MIMSRKTRGKHQLTAVNMRYILVGTLIATLIAMGAGVYFAYSFLSDVAEEVAQVQSRADSTDAELQYINQLEQKLEQYSTARERASQIVAQSQSYRYQDQVIQDLTQYASRAGLQISSFNFQNTESAGADTAAPPTPTTQGAPTSTQPDAAAAPANSIQSTMVSVQLSEPIPYRNLLHFIHLIEENLTRMQITELSLAPGDSGSTVSTQTLNIEVYLR